MVILCSTSNFTRIRIYCDLHNFSNSDFHKTEGKYCYQKQYHKEQDFSVAKEECAFDPDCLAFYQKNCKGNKFRLCKKSLEIRDSKSDPKSCLYLKGKD